jgi:hypothetical protein
MNARLLAIDPAAHGAAYAFFEGGRLRAANLLHREDPLTAVALMPPMYAHEQVVIEVPQVYQQRQWKGDPNDLINVALVVGMLMYRYRECAVQIVKPHDWKGSAPKKVMGDRILLALDASEQAVITSAAVRPNLRHNIIDAAGIGLWAGGRLRR